MVNAIAKYPTKRLMKSNHSQDSSFANMQGDFSFADKFILDDACQFTFTDDDCTNEGSFGYDRFNREEEPAFPEEASAEITVPCLAVRNSSIFKCNRETLASSQIDDRDLTFSSPEAGFESVVGGYESEKGADRPSIESSQKSQDLLSPTFFEISGQSDDQEAVFYRVMAVSFETKRKASTIGDRTRVIKLERKSKDDITCMC